MIFLFFQTSGPALVPTHTAVQWVQEIFPGEKRPEREVKQSSQTSAKVKKEWSNTCTSSTCLHGMDRESSTFYLSSYDTEFLCFIPAKSVMRLDIPELCFCPRVTIEMRLQLFIYSQSDIWTKICYYQNLPRRANDIHKNLVTTEMKNLLV